MILFAQGTKARVVICCDQSCMHLRCWQVKLCLTIYVKEHKYKTQVVILEWFAYFYYFGEISQIPLIISNNIFRTSNGKKYNSSNIFHSFQFLPEEIGRNSYLPFSSGCPGRNTFLPEEKQPCQSTCTWLVLDWKSTWCFPSTLSTCTCKYEKVLVLDSSTSKSTWPQPWLH